MVEWKKPANWPVASLRVSIVAVLGNHDFESDQPAEVAGALSEAGIHMLDGDTCEVHGIGFAGVKGSAGGLVEVRSAPGASRLSSSSCRRLLPRP